MDQTAPILVAEDNDFVRMQIVRFLKDSGYNVLEAANGNDALGLVKAQQISLCIVDVRMEPVDGFDFIRAVHGLNIESPVILVTGDNNPDILNTAGELKISAMLTKPVQKDRLVKTVERILAMKNRAS